MKSTLGYFYKSSKQNAEKAGVNLRLLFKGEKGLTDTTLSVVGQCYVFSIAFG